MSLNIDQLPAELKQEILTYLDWEDLSSMCLVSKRWNVEAEDPNLWENFGELFNWSVEAITSDKELERLFRMKRFRSLKQVAFHENFAFTKSTIRRLMKQNLQGLDIRQCDLRSAPSDLLTTLLAGLKNINLRGAVLTDSCKIKLFTKLEASNKLKTLFWPGADFSCLDPSLLVSVLSRLDDGHMNWSSTRFTPQQLDLLFAGIANRDITMKGINFECATLSHANPMVLARGLVKVKTLDLQYTFLTEEQVTGFFNLIAAGGSNLKNLDMRWEGSNLEKVDPFVLASAVYKLEKVRFCECRLDPRQLEAILVAVDEKSTLKSLDLRGWLTVICDGNQYPGEVEENWKKATMVPLLARARMHCEVLILGWN